MRMNANHAHERVSHQIMRMTTDVDFENYAFNTSIMRNHFHAHEITLSPQRYAHENLSHTTFMRMKKYTLTTI